MRPRVTALFLLIAFSFAANAESQTFGAWEYIEDIDPITDQNRSTIEAWAVNYNNPEEIQGLFVVRCYIPEPPRAMYGLEVFLITLETIPSGDYSVVYRIDRQLPESVEWLRSTSGEAIFASKYYLDDLVDAMFEGNELVIRLVSGGKELTYRVPLSGFREALLFQGCYDDTPIHRQWVANHSLFILARSGTARLIHEALADGAQISEDGREFLIAVLEGKPDTVRAFIEAGVDVNQPIPSVTGSVSHPPLLWAVGSPDDGVDFAGRITLLLNAGASTEVTYNGRTVYELARERYPYLEDFGLLERLRND